MRTSKICFICISLISASIFFSFLNNSRGSIKFIASSTGIVDSILVIMNDSTVGASTLKRKADRDTLRKYLPMLVGKVRYFTKDSSTVFPNLSNYSIIIYQETAWDDEIVRALSFAQRQAIKNWLAGGTPPARRGLIMIGADLGYNYDRTGSPYWDTAFSRVYGGFQFVVDNAASTATWASVGTAPAPGAYFNTMSITPPGGSYWPDGCRTSSGFTRAFNIYANRIDTLAGITKDGPGWITVSTFQDPRYFTGTGTTPSPNVGFKRILQSMIAWLKSWNLICVEVTNIGSEIPDKYSLSQNYPNPFNPVTRIEFNLIKPGYTSLAIYNITGKEVVRIVDEHLDAGSYFIYFNASGLSSGTYFYRLISHDFVETKKMLVIK
jgi:hypothetical protein